MEARTLAKDLSSLEQQLETFRGCRHLEGESFGRMEEPGRGFLGREAGGPPKSISATSSVS